MSIIQLLGTGDLVPAADPFAQYLVEALPLNSRYQFTDQSHRIRGSGSPATTSLTTYSPPIAISSLKSKFYGSSAKEPQTNPAGTTFHLSQINVDLGVANIIGTQNFCYEMWWYTEDFQFAGEDGWRMNYNNNSNGAFGPSYTPGDVPYIVFKGDNWANTSNFKRGVFVGSGPAQSPLYETSSQVLSPNTWHHIAITRSGTTSRAFVDGTLRASGTDNVNYQGYINIHGVLNRTLGSGMYLQDIRFYLGTPKYTSNFTPPGAMFI